MADETKAEDGVRPHLKKEWNLIEASRKVRGQPTISGKDDLLGVGISGGGVRSATFALGIFQALAGEKGNAENTLLEEIDYISTVSGGGYFGGFYGSLFHADRSLDAKGTPTPSGVEETSVQEGVESGDSTKESPLRKIERMLASDSEQIRYLRENSAYLAPAGPSDLFLGMAVLARNWVAVIVVLLGLVVVMSLGVDLLPLFLGSCFSALRDLYANLVAWGAGHGLLLSPLLLIVVAISVVWIIPAGWAYFLAGASWWLRRGDKRTVELWWGIMAVQVVLLTGISLLAFNDHTTFSWAGLLALAMVMVFRVSGDFIGARRVYAAYFSDELARVRAWELGVWTLACLVAVLFYSVALGPILLPDLSWFDPGPHVPGLPWFALGAEHQHWVRGGFFYAGLVGLVFATDLLLQGVGWLICRRVHGSNQRWSPEEGCRVDVDQYVRHCMSAWLRSGLQLAGIVLFAALIHTLGRTLYAHAVDGIETTMSLVSALGALLATAARRLVVKTGKGPDGSRPSWFLAAAMFAGGGIALTALLTTGVLLAQLIVFQGSGPIVARQSSADARDATPWMRARPQATENDDENDDEKDLLPPLNVASGLAPSVGRYPDVTARDVKSLLWDGGGTLLGLFLFLFAIGGLRRFLNNSTHLALYSARITRTFLGASNRLRVPPSAQKRDGIPPAAACNVATHLIPGDDMTLEEYFYRQVGENGQPIKGPYTRGAPLHLINVTINETVDGRSQTQQADRRGVGMAVGPCGLSVGVRHHAVFEWRGPRPKVKETDETGSEVSVYPLCAVGKEEMDAGSDESGATKSATKASTSDRPYRVFGFSSKEVSAANEAAPAKKLSRFGEEIRVREPGGFPGESLTLGRWLGISGAAFTTGLGSRTNVGLSLILALANIRLGHWWLSGVIPERRWTRVLGAIFWTQQYLLRELFARFAGTADRMWYLSDGGHFENLGGYELLRRRLKRIVIIDAEADPKRQFEGLGNLVRKARLDFGAEIEFLDESQLAKYWLGPARGIGTLASLRPSAEGKGWSKAYAALAKVTYSTPNDGMQTEKTGWLLYIKPSLKGCEPQDVLQYHSEHSDFPHEPTSDQFFDEAQWESYRRLGEHIGRSLFCGGTFPFSEHDWR